MEQDNNNIQDIQSRKNLEVTWYNFLGNSLLDIQQSLMLMKEGCESLPDLLQIEPRSWGYVLPNLQLKNQSMLITKLKIFLSNIKSILPKERNKKLLQKINLCEQLYRTGEIERDGKKIRLWKLQQVANRNKVVVIEELFYDIEIILSYVVEELVELLSPILFAKENFNQKKGEM